MGGGGVINDAQGPRVSDLEKKAKSVLAAEQTLPADASDVLDFEGAKLEVQRLRALIDTFASVKLKDNKYKTRQLIKCKALAAGRIQARIRGAKSRRFNTK